MLEKWYQEPLYYKKLYERLRYLDFQLPTCCDPLLLFATTVCYLSIFF